MILELVRATLEGSIHRTSEECRTGATGENFQEVSDEEKDLLRRLLLRFDMYAENYVGKEYGTDLIPEKGDIVRPKVYGAKCSGGATYCDGYAIIKEIDGDNTSVLWLTGVFKGDTWGVYDVEEDLLYLCKESHL